MFEVTEVLSADALPARLGDLLPRWKKVPLYAERLAGVNSAADFQRLALIGKREMREGFPGNFLSSPALLDELIATEKVELEYTSGTSEERLPVVFAKHWWNEQEQRALRLNRFVADVLDRHPQTRRGTITTPACNGQTCPTAWTPRNHRTFGDSLFLNLARIPFLLTEAELDRMAEEVSEWAPQFLDVAPVHGVWFALHCERRGLKFPSLRFVLCSYEFVSVVHRRIIERALGVPTLNLYGSTETGHLLMEADDGRMKPSLATAFLELVNTDARGIGNLVVTTLSNDYMPLLRYQIGDLAERRQHHGETHYIVHGRARDALTAASGQRVTTWQVDQLFRDIPGIAHYEVRPGRDGTCTLRYIPDGTGPTEAALAGLTKELADLLGVTSSLLTESVEVLVPTASGKFRLTAAPA
jgi:phenylacetate-CoA ligase